MCNVFIRCVRLVTLKILEEIDTKLRQGHAGDAQRNLSVVKVYLFEVLCKLQHNNNISFQEWGTIFTKCLIEY